MWILICFQTVFGRQFRVLEKVRDWLQHDDGGDVFNGNITVLSGIHAQGVGKVLL